MASNVPIGELVDTTPAKQPEHLTITGQYATLVPISPSHAPALYQHACQNSPDEAWAYMAVGPFADAESFTAHITAITTSKDPLFFTIITNIDLPGAPKGTPVGYLSLMRIDTTNRCIELGFIVFSTVLQRTTVATEALYLAMRHCFEGLGNRRLEWKCNDLNAKSRRAAERLGFVFEGTFRKHMIVHGRNRDTAWFSIVDDEWDMKKRALEAWLDKENFDGEGKQKKGLVDIRRELEGASSS